MANIKILIKNIYVFGVKLIKQPFYRLRCSTVPWSNCVELGTVINNSKIGKYCYIGPGTILNRVRTGNYCSIGPGVLIGGVEHSWWWGSTSTRISDKCIDCIETVLEEDVWVAANSVVKQGVHIGRGAVVGAGSVVVKDVERYSIVAGVPAKIIRKRFQEKTIERIEETLYWSYSPEKAKQLLDEIDFSENNILKKEKG